MEEIETEDEHDGGNVDEEGADDGAGPAGAADGQGEGAAAGQCMRLPRAQVGAGMVQVDARTLKTLIGALQGHQRQWQQERVKTPSYDGKSDPEDFLSVMRHLTQTYGWTRAERLAKLKTALRGRAQMIT